MENELISTEQIEQLIDSKNVKEIRRIFEVVPEIDIAEACADLEDVKKIVFILKTVKSEYTAEFFTDLPAEVKEEVIKCLSDVLSQFLFSLLLAPLRLSLLAHTSVCCHAVQLCSGS